jgi:tetratricopeptide (TPR) repeat protein
MKIRAAVVVLAGLALLAGCRTQTTVGPYQVPGEADRETSVAEKMNREAADIIDSNPSMAEALLRDALTKDLFFGPAHNNLGVVFLHQKKLYEAAHEFEWARKLLPGNPDPRVNLALTLESAGRLQEAFKTYETALEVAPEDLAAIEGLASLALRTNRDDPRLRGWLDQIALNASEPGWATWARNYSARRPSR